MLHNLPSQICRECKKQKYNRFRKGNCIESMSCYLNKKIHISRVAQKIKFKFILMIIPTILPNI